MDLSGISPSRAPKGVDRSAYVKVIPEQLLDLPNLRILQLDNQPIETPPPEVVATGIEGMRAYYRQLREGTDYLCESKLLIVGEGGAGKTSLARKIDDPDYELKDDEKSTEGIGVIPWSFPTRIRVEGKPETMPRDFHVSIWDFGGQEIYHATHQFFLTKRSLYVLVADSRKEDTDFQYWLNIVELLSDGSPLLIVKNEKQDRRRDINESRLRGRFGNLQRVLPTNLATNRGLDEVVKVIREELERLPHIGSPLPRTWRRVREVLEQDGRDHIPVEEYLGICRDNGFTREADMFQLSGYLHDLGVCLHFQDDPLLRKTVMLKPRWATDAVYRVLDSKRVIDRHGRFTFQDLSVIWSEPRYAAMRDELVQLMMKFQLCYPLSTKELLAPQLLESNPPAYPWEEQGNLVVRYEYEFMPKGILTRFIVATHFLIPNEEWLWRDGVVLERGGTRAEVIEDYPERRITVRLAGPEKQELLAIVDHELDKIHRGYPRLKMSRLIPCHCSTCLAGQAPRFYPYETLLKFARDGRPIQCPESYDMVDVQGLIAAVFPKTSSVKWDDLDGTAGVRSLRAEASAPAESQQEVFVSYAWGGESEQIVDRLEQTFRERGIAVVRDKSEMQYRDSIQDFMRRIGRGKAIVVVLSRKYLESTSCMFELTQIADRGEMRKRVFPIVLEDAGIFEAVDRVAYVKAWESKIRKLNAALRKVNQEDLKGIREELDLYAEIRRTITQLMEILRDMNAFTPAEHLDSRFTALTSAIEEQIRS
ncbi:MAG TPA: COR domain-containing protein [Thermoanaerobaculia bacterium]|nr:COR domain-containing protein [Thermoanaerobaculia bacterium]